MNVCGHDVSLFTARQRRGKKADVEGMLDSELIKQGIKVINIYDYMKDNYENITTDV